MKKLTKKDAIRLFRKDWKHKAKTGQKDKCCPPDVVEGWNMRAFQNECFLCEYDQTHKRRYCSKSCIIKWPYNRCIDRHSPYHKWSCADTEDERKKWAKIIAKLPERK